jgi:hypothetical protein
MIRKKDYSKIRNEKLGERLKKILNTRSILIAVILIFLFLLLKQYFKGILLLLIFFPMSLYTVRVTRFVNYITLETNTASTILMAYLYGPVIGTLAGFMLSAYGYFANSVTKFLSMIDMVLTALTGLFVGALLHGKMPFSIAFIIAILVKNGIGFVLYHFFFDPDKVQNVVYRTTHLIWNIFIVRLLYELIYAVYMAI